LVSLKRMNERLTKFFRKKSVPVNDLSVILSREETVGRVRVTVAEEGVRVSDWTCRRVWRWRAMRDWSVF